MVRFIIVSTPVKLFTRIIARCCHHSSTVHLSFLLFSLIHHLFSMSIDDGGYPIGTNIEVRKVSSSDWNEPWSRQVRPTIRHPEHQEDDKDK
jgi:hypothetical protein